MAFYSVSNPFMQVFNLQGTGLNDGDVYFGVAGQDPITNPKVVYWDIDGIDVADQPIETTGGYLYRSGTPAALFIDGTYSIKVFDKKGGLVYYQANVIDSVLKVAEDLANYETLVAGSTGSSLVGFIQAGTGAVASTVQTEIRAISVTLEQFGGGVGVADNRAAFQSALNQLAGRGGGNLVLLAGNYNVASASLSSNAITVPANVTIVGKGKGVTTITVTGTTQTAGLFASSNVGNIVLEGATIIGNNKSTGYADGACYNAILTSGAVADIKNITVRDVYLDNFAAPYWINVENDSATYSITNVDIDVEFISRNGNSIFPALVTYNAVPVCVNGFAGAIRDIVVKVSGDANYIKGGVNIFNRIINADIYPKVNNAGVVGATNDAGAYAVQIYDSMSTAAGIRVHSPFLTNPRSVGVYVAGCDDVTLFDPQVSGQIDTVNGTLPKGAVVWNGSRHPVIIGGSLTNNFIGMHITPPASGGNVDGRFDGLQASGNSITLNISYFPGAIANGYYFDNCLLAGTPIAGSAVVRIQNSVAAYINNIQFSGGYIRNDAGTGRALDLFVDSGSPASGYTFSNMPITGAVYANAMTNTVTFFNTTVTGDAGAGAANSSLLNSKISLTDVTFSGGGAGFALDTTGSTGTSRGLTFPGSPNPFLDTASLGVLKPTFSGTASDTVQNISSSAYTPQGVALSQYTIAEWVCGGTTTWNDRRALTGT